MDSGSKLSSRTMGAFGLWVLVVFGGSGLFMKDVAKQGPMGNPPSTWPHEAALIRSKEKPTLVTFFHPHCPCSRASLSELMTLLGRRTDAVDSMVVFVQPTGASNSWAETDLWRKASSLPGISAVIDRNGLLANQFQAKTSGYTLLYDSNGELLFAGGVTPSRGQIGPNAGREKLTEVIRYSSKEKAATPVYGCPLFAPEENEVNEDASVKIQFTAANNE